MTIAEAKKRIEELEKENAQLKAELAKYDGKKPAGRRLLSFILFYTFGQGESSARKYSENSSKIL